MRVQERRSERVMFAANILHRRAVREFSRSALWTTPR